MLQCHVWQFTEDVLFLKQHENKSAKNPQEFISKADGIKALVLHVEEGRGGRISTFRSWEKSLSFSSEGKFNKNIHCCEGGTFRSICWAIEAHCDAQSWDVSTAFPAQVLWAAFSEWRRQLSFLAESSPKRFKFKFSCFLVLKHFQTMYHLKKETKAVPVLAPSKISWWQIYLKLRMATKNKT